MIAIPEGHPLQPFVGREERKTERVLWPSRQKGGALSCGFSSCGRRGHLEIQGRIALIPVISQKSTKAG